VVGWSQSLAKAKAQRIDTVTLPVFGAVVKVHSIYQQYDLISITSVRLSQGVEVATTLHAFVPGYAVCGRYTVAIIRPSSSIALARESTREATLNSVRPLFGCVISLSAKAGQQVQRFEAGLDRHVPRINSTISD